MRIFSGSAISLENNTVARRAERHPGIRESHPIVATGLAPRRQFQADFAPPDDSPCATERGVSVVPSGIPVSHISQNSGAMSKFPHPPRLSVLPSTATASSIVRQESRGSYVPLQH